MAYEAAVSLRAECGFASPQLPWARGDETAPCPVHADRGLPSQRVPHPEHLLQGEVRFRALSVAALCPGAWLFAQVMSPVGWRGRGKPIASATVKAGGLTPC